MPDLKQLPYLLKLLDDESKTVRQEITRQLLAFGPRLKEEVAKIPENIFPMKSRVILTGILEDQERIRLRQRWSGWQEVEPDTTKLETALSFLAEFQSGLTYAQNLTGLLDSLAEEYQKNYSQTNAFDLARFLFHDKNLRGAEADYYHPQNSNLVHVITQKEGLPISLVCIYMLVGARLGLTIEGCNFPGHFMARFDHEGKYFLVDCYNGGKTIEEGQVVTLDPGKNPMKGSPLGADAVTIIRRVLINLTRAYELKDESANQQCMMELLKSLNEQSPSELPKKIK